MFFSMCSSEVGWFPLESPPDKHSNCLPEDRCGARSGRDIEYLREYSILPSSSRLVLEIVAICQALAIPFSCGSPAFRGRSDYDRTKFLSGLATRRTRPTRPTRPGVHRSPGPQAEWP